MHDWQMFSRDQNYQLSGGLRLSSAQAVVRHLGVDTAVIETPYTPDAYARTAPGCGIVLYRDGRQEFSGLVGSERSMGWDASTSQPTIKVQCLGDNVHLNDRLCFPAPAYPGDQQTYLDYWIGTFTASTAMYVLIDQQLGPHAIPERQVPRLSMGSDPGIGPVRPWQALFNTVLEACAEFSAVSGVDPGIRMVSTPDGLRCDIYQPRALSGAIKFSADLSNLTGFTYTETPPSVTYALVAGQGDLRARMRVASTSTSPTDLLWGRRIEQYIDRRDEDDPTVLKQAADDAITQGVGQVSLSCTSSDSQAATYGVDWVLGDRVQVYVGLPGQVKAAIVDDVVREISFAVTNAGAETITPAIGTTDAKAVMPTPTQKTLAQVQQSLTNLIRRQ